MPQIIFVKELQNVPTFHFILLFMEKNEFNASESKMAKYSLAPSTVIESLSTSKNFDKAMLMAIKVLSLPCSEVFDK